MAKFPKGQSGNPKGRIKGSPNKSTEKIKAAFQKLLEDNLPTLQSDLDHLEPAQRLNYIKELSEYILPKLARVDGQMENTDEVTIRIVDDDK